MSEDILFFLLLTNTSACIYCFMLQVEEELWEQAFIEACFEDMLAEEELHWYFSQLPAHSHACMTTVPWDSFYDSPLSQLSLDCRAEEVRERYSYWIYKYMVTLPTVHHSLHHTLSTIPILRLWPFEWLHPVFQEPAWDFYLLFVYYLNCIDFSQIFNHIT